MPLALLLSLALPARLLAGCGSFGGSDSTPSSDDGGASGDAATVGQPEASSSAGDGGASGQDGGAGVDCNATAGNLLGNPGFEMGCASGGWTTSKSGNSTGIPARASIAACGTSACLICPATNVIQPGNEFVFLQTVSPAGGGTYQALAYLRADPAGSSAGTFVVSAEIDSVDQAQNPVTYGQPTQLALDSTWTALETPKTHFDDAGAVRFILTATAPGCFLIDGASIVRNP